MAFIETLKKAFYFSYSMGFFDFLKKQKESRTVSFKELDKWLNEEIGKKDIEGYITSFRDQMIEKIESTKESMANLEQASLLNEKIPERLKHIMRGNRENYIRKINIFLSDLKLPYDYESLLIFAEKLKMSIDKLSKDTQKSYMILNEFLATELMKVVKHVKELELLTAKTKKNLEHEGLENLVEIKLLLKNLREIKDKSEDIRKKNRTQQDALKLLEQKISSKNAEIKSSKESKEKSEYDKLMQMNQKANGELKAEEQELWNHFSTLEKALKKYKRLSLNEKLIDSYLEKPSTAIMNDSEIQIVEILESMKKSLDKLGLKDKKLEKTEEEIARLSRDYLKNKRETLSRIYTILKQVEESLATNIFLKEVESSENELDRLNKEKHDLKVELEANKKLLKKDRDKEIIEEIQKKMELIGVVLENE